MTDQGNGVGVEGTVGTSVRLGRWLALMIRADLIRIILAFLAIGAAANIVERRGGHRLADCSFPNRVARGCSQGERSASKPLSLQSRCASRPGSCCWCWPTARACVRTALEAVTSRSPGRISRAATGA